MRCRNDDELGAVNNEWLGPPGTYLFRARYWAWPFAAAVMVVLMAVEHRVGVGPSVMQALYTVTAAVLVTRTVGRWITAETPFRVLPAVGWNELTAPRRLGYRHRAVFTPAAVPVRPILPEKWWARG